MSGIGRAGGMSLVGFMVALGLGALLLLLATELILASRRSLLWQAAATRLERAGERGLSLLEAELRMAGFRAGVRTATVPAGAPDCGGGDGWALALEPSLAFADRRATEGVQLSDGSTAACLPLARLQPGSDLLALRRAGSLASGTPERPLRDTQWYLLADERGQGVFHYLGADEGAQALPAGGREVREWRTMIFYVRAYSVTPGDGVPTLCVERLKGAAMRSECLVEGVERLAVTFHIDRDGDGRGDDTLAAPSAAELSRATGVTLYLHARSLASLRPPGVARELRLGSEQVTIPAGDPFLHRVFVRTVPLLNLGGAAP